MEDYKSILVEFKKISLFAACFKIGFLVLFGTELLLFLLFLTLLQSSSLLALTLGALFLTGFTYIILLFYFEAKKPEELRELKENFINSCRKSLSVPKGIAEHHLSIVNASFTLVAKLQDMEYSYVPPKYLKFLKFILEKISHALYQRDLFMMKELILIAAIDEHIEQIKHTPTDLEMHASLANSYTMLSKLYLQYLDTLTFFSSSIKDIIKEKLDVVSKGAIEELKILSEYAPNDPWVHAQLAQSYRSLKKQKEEADELETILKLSPNDNEVFFRLAALYFQMGNNAKGLKIYEQLKKNSYKKADELLNFYSSVKVYPNYLKNRYFD